MKTSICSLVVCVLLLPLHVGAQETIVTLTDAEYRDVVDRFLPCPSPRVGDDVTQLCLRIIPPGHRANERELLVTLQVRGGRSYLEWKQPDKSLARVATKAKSSRPTQWLSELKIAVSSMCTSDSHLIESVVGPAWRELTSPILPSDEWFTDPTLYQVRAHSIGGTVAIEMDGPGKKAERQPTPLLIWAEAVRDKAEALLRETATPGFRRSCAGANLNG